MFLKAAAEGQDDRIEMLRDSAPRYEYETRDLVFTHGAIEAYSLSSAANAELERDLEDVAAVVDSIDQPVRPLGHSHGGLCVLDAALRTDDLASLIVYEPAGPWKDISTPRRRSRSWRRW